MTHPHAGTKATQQQAARIAITGMGFISPVGGNVWETALAMRKKRSSFFSHETVLVADDHYGTRLCGAPVSRVPEEKISRYLCGADRAVAMLSAALRECTAEIPPFLLQNASWQVDTLLEPTGQDFTDRFQTVLQEMSVAGERGSQANFGFPRCLLFERLIQAVERLRQGEEQMALVGCADSLVTNTRLDALLLAGRLKDAVNPEGIMVGEAAGIFLLEKEAAARRRNAHIYATIAAWGRASEPNPWNGANPSTGTGLTEAFHRAFAMLDDAGASVETVIADLNGERSRAMEWAYTEGRVFPDTKRERVLRHPADTLGDCGGAMGAAIMVNALAGFMLHHSPPGRVALTTSDEAGARRVICLEPGDRMDRRLFFAGLRRQLQKEKHQALPEEERRHVQQYYR